MAGADMIEAVRDIVEEYGRHVENRVRVGKEEPVGWAVRSVERFELTESEERALEWLKDTFEIDRLKRSSKGLDFQYGRVGFEVKSDLYWDLSEHQVEHSKELEYVVIVLSNDDGVRIGELYDQYRIGQL